MMTIEQAEARLTYILDKLHHTDGVAPVELAALMVQIADDCATPASRKEFATWLRSLAATAIDTIMELFDDAEEREASEHLAETGEA